MTPEQLLEAMKRAISGDYSGPLDDWDDEARAALAVALEAAEKVADVHFAAGAQRHEIAAAIRALVPVRKEGGE